MVPLFEHFNRRKTIRSSHLDRGNLQIISTHHISAATNTNCTSDYDTNTATAEIIHWETTGDDGSTVYYSPLKS